MATELAVKDVIDFPVPKSKENEFYGFFAFSGKMTAFIGPLCLGYLTEIFNSQRAGVSIVVVLFIIGLFLLKMVDEKEGVATAKISLTK